LLFRSLQNRADYSEPQDVDGATWPSWSSHVSQHPGPQTSRHRSVSKPLDHPGLGLAWISAPSSTLPHSAWITVASNALQWRGKRKKQPNFEERLLSSVPQFVRCAYLCDGIPTERGTVYRSTESSIGYQLMSHSNLPATASARGHNSHPSVQSFIICTL
jgi:hypothetical protein